MLINKLVPLVILIILFNTNNLYTQICGDSVILDGSEQVTNYGIDTTGNWWAVTQPSTGVYRLVINGYQCPSFYEIKNFIFSPDGLRWAFFGKDATQWYLVTNNNIITLPGTDAGEMVFSNNSQELIYTYFDGSQEYLIFKDRKIIIYNRYGNLYTSYGGEKFAFMGYRGERILINVNGKESPLFDSIIPIGFWYDGSFLYVGQSGDSWEIYKNNESISDLYIKISGVAINHNCNVAAVLAQRTKDEAVGILISDEFYDPLVGKPYNSVRGLALHPTLAMYSYIATYQEQTYVVLSSTEFFGGQQTGNPHFTWDGNDLYFLGCDFDCFLNINGRKYKLNTELDTELNYAVKPGSNTFSYSTSSSLIIRNVETKSLLAGKMMDEIIQPIYNWKTQRYEALGKINQRLYFLFCKP